jgi:hypothetical protein
LPCWAEEPSASLREAMALLSSPEYEQAVALCEQVYPGLFRRSWST